MLREGGMFRKVLWIKERFIKVLRDGGMVYESVEVE